MHTLKVSATKARNNFFTILDQVSSGTSVVVKKDNREVAVIQPVERTDHQSFLRALEKSAGILKNYGLQENPLRKSGAKDFLGNWDK